MYGLVGHTIRQQQRLGLSDLEASWIPAPLCVLSKLLPLLLKLIKYIA